MKQQQQQQQKHTAPESTNTYQRPQKRQRCVDVVLSGVVTLLHDIGTVNYNEGNYKHATECFLQALCNIHSNSESYQHNSSDEEADENAVCIEYDEGMRVYDSLLEMESIRDSNNTEELSAVLCYNIGQTYIQRRQNKKAKSFLIRSLDKFSSFYDVNPLCIIMTLHNLGYCYYTDSTENKNQEGTDRAIVFYQRAFAIVLEHNLGNFHLAACSNSLGVVLFNHHSDDDEGNNDDIAMALFYKSLDLYRVYGSTNNVNSSSIATVLNNIGRIHFIKSEFEQALKSYEECLEMRHHDDNQSIDMAATAYNLGQTLYHLGLLDQALPYYHKYLKTMTTSSSITWPRLRDIAQVYKGIGQIYQDKSDHKMALHHFRKALEALQKVSSKNGKTALDVEIAAILNKLGSLCYEMKDFRTALAYYQKGLERERCVLETNHPHAIVTMINIGHIQKQLGEYEKALSAYQQAYEMQTDKRADNETVRGNNDQDDGLSIAETLSSIGLMQYHLQQYIGSFDSYQEALRIRRYHYSGDDKHPEVASTLNAIGLVLFKQELFGPAKDCFQESLRIRSKLLGKDHRDVAILWYNIATVHFETGEDDLAVQMYKETLRVERHNLGDDHNDIVLTLKRLGQVHLQIGCTEEAVDYFQEALCIERRRTVKEQYPSNDNELSIARILNLLGNAYLQLGRTSDMMNCFVEGSRIYESNNQACNTGNRETLVIGGYSFYGLNKTNPPCAPVA